MSKSSTTYTIGTGTVDPNYAVGTVSVPYNTVIIKNNYSENIQVTLFYKNGNHYEVVFSKDTTTMRSVPEGLSINSVSIQSNAGGQIFNTNTFENTSTLIFTVDKNFQISVF